MTLRCRLPRWRGDVTNESWMSARRGGECGKMHVRIAIWLMALVMSAWDLTASAAGPDAPKPPEKRTALKVCADPYSLPMSDKNEAGYENRIASLFGRKLGLPVVYEWFPQRMGFIRNTLKNNETEDGSYKCDIVMGVVDNFELAATTVPYMRSAWSLVYVKGRGLDYVKSQSDLKSLSDEKRAAIKPGVWDQGPATQWVALAGLMEQAVPYVMQSGDAKVGPTQILDDLVAGKINLTFVWGPIAGWYAKQTKSAELVVIPMESELGIKFDYQIAMAVREKDKAWKAQVNKLIEDNRAEIEKIIKDDGVPLLPLQKKENDDDD